MPHMSWSFDLYSRLNLVSVQHRLHGKRVYLDDARAGPRRQLDRAGAAGRGARRHLVRSARARCRPAAPAQVQPARALRQAVQAGGGVTGYAKFGVYLFTWVY